MSKELEKELAQVIQRLDSYGRQLTEEQRSIVESLLARKTELEYRIRLYNAMCQRMNKQK